jgi:hypothetical protein
LSEKKDYAVPLKALLNNLRPPRAERVFHELKKKAGKKAHFWGKIVGGKIQGQLGPWRVSCERTALTPSSPKEADMPKGGFGVLGHAPPLEAVELGRRTRRWSERICRAMS